MRHYSSKSMIISASLPQTVHTRVSFCFFFTTFGATGTSMNSHVTVISASLPHLVQVQTSLFSVIVTSPLVSQLRFKISQLKCHLSTAPHNKATIIASRHSGMFPAGIRKTFLDTGSRPIACRDGLRRYDGWNPDTCFRGAVLSSTL
jgi:hypothetical protein